jgi:hypothetical protein
MKRWILVLFISCFILLFVGVVYAALIPIPVENPNFESDLSGWDVVQNDCTVEWDEGGNFDVGQAVVTCGYGYGFGRLQQTFNITDLGVYTATVWYGCEHPSGDISLGYWGNEQVEAYEAKSLCSGEGFDRCDVSVEITSSYISQIYIVFGMQEGDRSGDNICAFDNVELNYELPIPPTVDSVTIPLSSGNQFIVNYTWTFGEMAITALLAIVIVAFCARWMYDVVIQLWSMRGDNDKI